MSRPVIGVTSYCEPASWGPWTRVTAVLVPQRYTSFVHAAGGLPFVLPTLGDQPDPDESTPCCRSSTGWS